MIVAMRGYGDGTWCGWCSYVEHARAFGVSMPPGVLFCAVVGDAGGLRCWLLISGVAGSGNSTGFSSLIACGAMAPRFSCYLAPPVAPEFVGVDDDGNA